MNATVADQYILNLAPGGLAAEVTLIPRSGDADLYILLAPTGTDPLAQIKPNSTKYDYRSVAAFGNDVLDISPGDAPYVANNCAVGCVVFIAVIGFYPRFARVPARARAFVRVWWRRRRRAARLLAGRDGCEIWGGGGISTLCRLAPLLSPFR